MESVINYTEFDLSSSSFTASIFTFLSTLAFFALCLPFPPPTKLSTILFLRLFILSPLFLTRPPLQCLPLPLPAPTPGSKVSCLTVNVLSFPQREAARRQRENYSVLRSINLPCDTRTHTHTHTHLCWRAFMLSCEFKSDGTYCFSSVCVCVCEDMRGRRTSQQFSVSVHGAKFNLLHIIKARLALC